MNCIWAKDFGQTGAPLIVVRPLARHPLWGNPPDSGTVRKDFTAQEKEFRFRFAPQRDLTP
eukprot:11941773-Alexandrium_andersonii.AAC.1